MAISYSIARTLRDYDMTSAEGRRRWVFDHWVQIAPYGYSAYLRHGRGAVPINGRQGPDTQPPRWLTPEVAQTMSSELVTLYDAFTAVCLAAEHDGKGKQRRSILNNKWRQQRPID